MEQALTEMPPWLVTVIAAVVAAVVGGLVGALVVRRREVPPGSYVDPYAPPPDPMLRRETPAFKSLQTILEAKGLSAKDQDSRLRDFASDYPAIQRKLSELAPAGDGRHLVARKALAALEQGEFEQAITLTEKVGKEEGAEGLELRDKAARLLQASASAKVVAGDLYMALMAPENARDLYQQASDELPPSAEAQRAEVLNKLGTACYQCGDHDQAVRAFTRGMRLLEKTLGTEHPDVATALNNLALIHYSKGNYPQAEPLYRRALMIDEKVLGYDHPGVATDLNNLALLYKKQGNLEGAEPLLKRALSIKERTFDPGHPSLVTGLKNYASVLRSLGRGDEAKDYESRAAAIPPSRTVDAA